MVIAVESFAVRSTQTIQTNQRNIEIVHEDQNKVKQLNSILSNDMCCQDVQIIQMVNKSDKFYTSNEEQAKKLEGTLLNK